MDIGKTLESLNSWASFDINRYGELLATALERLSDKVDVNNIHLIGHSIGAHIAGKAGQVVTERSGKVLPRITGLDPARPCSTVDQHNLQKGDAKFVDVIHTNAGVLGISEAVGDIDFYPNL